jgi:hypothetical protein
VSEIFYDVSRNDRNSDRKFTLGAPVCSSSAREYGEVYEQGLRSQQPGGTALTKGTDHGEMFEIQ